MEERGRIVINRRQVQEIILCDSHSKWACPRRSYEVDQNCETAVVHKLYDAVRETKPNFTNWCIYSYMVCIGLRNDFHSFDLLMLLHFMSVGP
jgi:hypothetical protein